LTFEPEPGTGTLILIVFEGSPFASLGSAGASGFVFIGVSLSRFFSTTELTAAEGSPFVVEFELLFILTLGVVNFLTGFLERSISPVVAVVEGEAEAVLGPGVSKSKFFPKLFSILEKEFIGSLGMGLGDFRTSTRLFSDAGLPSIFG
jgi:hypothetical protein